MTRRFPVALLCFLLLLLALLPPQPRLEPEAPAVGKAEAVHRVYLPLVSYSLHLNKKGVGASGSVPCESLAALGITRLRSWQYDAVRRCPGMASYACVWNPAMAYRAIAAGYIAGERQVIAFNECDMADQCATQPEAAVQAFHDLTAAFPNREFGLPSTFVSRDWLPRFWSTYVAHYGQAPRVAFVDCHVYHDYADTSIEQVQYYVAFAKRYGIPEVWVTEYLFGHWNPWTGRTDAQAAAEARVFQDWMEGEPMVAAYFWFAGHIKPGEPWYPAEWGIPNLFFEWGGVTVYGQEYGR